MRRSDKKVSTAAAFRRHERDHETNLYNSLEQLELESRGAGAGSRVAAYRAELQRVRNEYRSVLNSAGGYNIDTEDVYDDWGANEQQRTLLDNSERLERTGKTLTEGYRVVLETEQIGAAVLQDLSAQRESIQRTRGRVIVIKLF
ncbi:vesicle transport through interaction with t-SNAREs homolog 1A [Hyposmocoma kahamanoa]|uniref:vesicle transport through interaction with t-SNAREs homolog 1A n=1 Tax=Hyposmocoma kahamanoa TaxID=1477025 RepID=UPI000E6D66D5|nr:vesicle transport through interaction with t-SNAREs homolog 1A [Hyposmocoma kahamanoa]